MGAIQFVDVFGMLAFIHVQLSHGFSQIQYQKCPLSDIFAYIHVVVSLPSGMLQFLDCKDVLMTIQLYAVGGRGCAIFKGSVKCIENGPTHSSSLTN